MNKLQLQAQAELELRKRKESVAGALPLLAWTERYRHELKPGVSLDFTEHPYLRALYQASDREVVVSKAAQMGASEYAISYALHGADVRKATILYIFPTDVHVSDFSSARIGPALEASSYLSSLVVSGADDDRSGADRVTLKRIGDRFLYLRGAKVSPTGSAPQLKSIDADMLILDEVDEMDERAPEIAKKRLGHSKIGEIRWISTPTYPGRGIHAKWLESDQREWMLRCPHCNAFQFLTINHFVTEWDSLKRPIRWHGSAEGRSFPACEKCGRELDRLAPGQWVAAEPTAEIAGFHLTKLFSPLADPLKIIKALQTADETARREAYNQDLGETYTPSGGQLTDEILDKCQRPYGHGAQAMARTVAGVDVGKVLHCVIRTPAWREHERQQLFAGIVDSWDELGNLFRRYRVRTAVIDALPEGTKVREFQAKFRAARIWVAYYVGQATGSRAPEPWNFDEKDGTVLLDRTRTLDATFARFYEGVATLPGNIRSAVRDYYPHMKAPVRVIEDRGGSTVATYVESGPDHFAHAENYCLVAEHGPRVPMGIVAQGSVKGW